MRQKHDKEQIIEKGIQIFREKGYHHTGVDDILKASQIPSGSFYNFFGSKEGFAVQALDYYNQWYIDYLTEILNNKRLSPIKRLRKAFKGNVDGHVKNNCSVGCLLNSLTSEVGGLDTPLSEKIIDEFSKNNKLISDTIREGQRLGEIRKDYSASDLANYLINGFIGATVRMKAGNTSKPLHLFMRTAFNFIKA